MFISLLYFIQYQLLYFYSARAFKTINMLKTQEQQNNMLETFMRQRVRALPMYRLLYVLRTL